MKKQVKLRVGDIWQVPIWTPLGLSRKNGKQQILDVRTIEAFLTFEGKFRHKSKVYYYDIGGQWWDIRRAKFLSWTKKAKLIGYYDFETRKAVTVKWNLTRGGRSKLLRR